MDLVQAGHQVVGSGSGMSCTSILPVTAAEIRAVRRSFRGRWQSSALRASSLAGFNVDQVHVTLLHGSGGVTKPPNSANVSEEMENGGSTDRRADKIDRSPPRTSKLLTNLN